MTLLKRFLKDIVGILKFCSLGVLDFIHDTFLEVSTDRKKAAELGIKLLKCLSVKKTISTAISLFIVLISTKVVVIDGFGDFIRTSIVCFIISMFTSVSEYKSDIDKLKK